MNSAPEKIPAELSPAIALSTINVVESGAAPQMRGPVSNKASALKKTHLTLILL